MLLIDDSIRSRPRQYVRISSTYVPPVSSVRDLGVHINSDVSLQTRHRHHQIVLCSTTSDSERSALPSTTCPADTNPCFGCQQGRLLLLRAGRCLRGHLLDRLQSILNAAARLVFSASRSERITATFIGCGSRNGFNSVSAFWHSDVSMDQRRHISLRAFVRQPMWKVVATTAHLPP